MIGITDTIERRHAVQDNGLLVINDFPDFEKEDIETLCSSVRKPGGTIANLHAGDAG